MKKNKGNYKAICLIAFIALLIVFSYNSKPPPDFSYIQNRYNECLDHASNKHNNEVTKCNKNKDSFVRSGCLQVSILDYHNGVFSCMDQRIVGILNTLEGRDEKELDQIRKNK